MTVPVWLLDVDGVLNAARPGWGAAPRRAVAFSGGMNWPIRWAPALLNRIRALHASGMVEIRWCTTWCPDAENLERLFRLPALPRALDMNPVPRGAEGQALKLAAAKRVLEDEGRYLVWTDDDAVPASWLLREELAADGRALLISPPPRRGLQPPDMDAIEEFARAHQPTLDMRSSGRRARPRGSDPVAGA
ncbi:MAG: hypothetical protein V7603_1980 [Micromonosporaceae bacterium]